MAGESRSNETVAAELGTVQMTAPAGGAAPSLTRYVARFAALVNGTATCGMLGATAGVDHTCVALGVFECAQYARWPHRKAAQAISLVRDLESLDNIAELTACLAG